MWSLAWDYFLYAIGGITPQLMVLFDFMVAHIILHIMLSVKYCEILPLKNHYCFIQRRIASMIIIGVAQSIDALSGIDAIYNVVVYYFIAQEGRYIVNIAKEIDLPIPEQLSAGIKRLGNYESGNDKAELKLPEKRN